MQSQMGLQSPSGACNAPKYSAPTHKAIINDGSNWWLWKPSNIICVRCKEAFRGAYHINEVVQDYLDARYLKRWIPRHFENQHDLMEGPLSQKELPAHQSPKLVSCTQLSYSRSNIASNQQPSIIWVVAYLTSSDIIKRDIDISLLCQNDSGNIAKKPSVCPRIYRQQPTGQHRSVVAQQATTNEVKEKPLESDVIQLRHPRYVLL